jgi:hypothetical protein
MADGKMGLDDELKEACKVFRLVKEHEWLPWAGEVLMVDFVKEVEAEQRVEEEERWRTIVEEEQWKQEEEEE